VKAILCIVVVPLRSTHTLNTRKRNMEYPYRNAESGTGNLPNVSKSFVVIRPPFGQSSILNSVRPELMAEG
jgi:hypothetical protein